jgi:SAM-dependent methyltransferase
MAPDYDLITEVGGTPITDEAASMVYTRYAVAADLARGRRTLEIGCASGVGLGLLLHTAPVVIGGDIHLPMLRNARAHYEERVPLVQFSATALPFCDGSFDLVLFLEATYYVRDFSVAVDEIGRVLAPGGLVLFVNANPERPDFIQSPYSEHYHSIAEFRALLEPRGYEVQTCAAFPLNEKRKFGIFGHVVSHLIPLARRIAQALRLIPRTLRGRARIKRLIFGNLRAMPIELPRDFARAVELVPVDSARVSGHKVIYVLGQRSSSHSLQASRSGHAHSATSSGPRPVLSSAAQSQLFD